MPQVLTRLLSDSLGGNCKTSLVVCASPAAGLFETSLTLTPIKGMHLVCCTVPVPDPTFTRNAFRVSQ